MRIKLVFQLVRRANPLKAIQQPNITKDFTTRERFLSTALLSVLSVNVFMLSGVLSFCTFAFWYPQ
jgi:hypothetical protein